MEFGLKEEKWVTKAVGMQQLVYDQKSGSTSFIFHETKAKHFIYH